MREREWIARDRLVGGVEEERRKERQQNCKTGNGNQNGKKEGNERTMIKQTLAKELTSPFP
jgi:hypothetical protein